MRMTFTKSTAALIAALAAPALALPAFAQTAPAAPAPAQTAPAPSATTPAPAAKGHVATRREHRADLTPAQRAARVEARITSLHKQLAITTAQQPQWDAFAQVMRDNAKSMDKSFETRGSRLASMNAADNMQSYADVAVAHAQDVQRLATAFQSLYGSFSDSQKQTADMLFRHDEHKPAAKAPSK
jgi:protein CpxP